MSDKYILVNRQPVPAGLHEWAEWYETADRTVAKTAIDEGTFVSTIFLGLDHSFGGWRPLLFETMVFGGPMDQEQDRYPTWEEAEAGHREMVERVRRMSSRSTPDS